MTKYTPTAECGYKAARLLPFHNSSKSFRGAVANPEYDPDGCDYIVSSYSTIVAVHHPECGWFIKPNVYSVTTSKQVGYLRRAVGSYIVWDKPSFREQLIAVGGAA